MIAAGIMATASTDSGGNGGQANSNNGADANASTTGTSNADNLQKIKLRQLATKAKGHFDQGKYDDCIGVLKSIVKDLVEKGEGGLKASHNIALCEYHQTVCASKCRLKKTNLEKS